MLVGEMRAMVTRQMRVQTRIGALPCLVEFFIHSLIGSSSRISTLWPHHSVMLCTLCII